MPRRIIDEIVDVYEDIECLLDELYGHPSEKATELADEVDGELVDILNVFHARLLALQIRAEGRT